MLKTADKKYTLHKTPYGYSVRSSHIDITDQVIIISFEKYSEANSWINGYNFAKGWLT